MVRKKDHFWEYVEELDGRFKCNFCEQDFAGGAPRIKSHLAGVKGRDIDICAKVPDDVQAEAYLAIGGHSKKLKITSNSSNVEQSKKIIEEIGSNHVVQFITDNATNFESVGDMLIGKYPHLYKTRCAAHGIQLLLKDIYEEVNRVQKHTIVLSLMRAHTNNKNLKHPCTTRFASNFLMLQSILNVESKLRLLVASSDWRGLDYSKKDIAKEVTNIIQSTKFWSQGHEVLLVLEPLVRVLRLVNGDGSTAGYLYEAMERAKEAIQQRCGNNQEKYIWMWELFEGRRTQNIIHPIHSVAAFLNPAYMYSGTFTENREMKEGTSLILENLVALEEKIEFMGQVQLYRMKLSSLFTKTTMTMLKTCHPRIWWDYCGDSLPVLKKYAIRILSQPCSSSSCERNWSAFEAAQTKKRNRLTPKMLDDFVYVRMNTMMMEKFNTLEARDVEPIDLDKLNELPEHEYVSQEQDTENDTLSEEAENINDHVIDDTDLSWLN
ncbi:hypothetical protein SO802_011543 [Lithocarpus litseifolius]|uniref:BED-type domain-containing protein n=1 Tax=Lithocarpus litseifolius TaxID=425828 RepID=A0AAW2D0B1_9ROSI